MTRDFAPAESWSFKIEDSLNGGMCVSPDEGCVLVTQTDHRGSSLMLVENFR
jgi:hypothetical protein